MLDTKKAFERIIDIRAEQFLTKIKNISSGNNYYRTAYSPVTFPLFVDDSDYNEQKYFEELIENSIWRYLINGVLNDLFNTNEINRTGARLEWIYKHPQLTTSYVIDIEDRYPIEFVIENQNGRTGYRYTYCFFRDENWEKLFRENQLTSFVILDFTSDEQTMLNNQRYGAMSQIFATEYIDKVEKVLFKDFFTMFFSNDAYSYYKETVRRIVSEANQYVGMKTIRVLTRQSLPLFIEERLHETRSHNFKNDTYTIVSREKLKGYVLSKIDNKRNAITDSDFIELNKMFFGRERYRSLYGSEDFAHSFITSEYLYKTMTDNNQFDYTAIVCGYLKSIEQLMYKIVLCTLDQIGEEWTGLWILKNGKNYDETIKQEFGYPKGKSKKHVKFKSANKDYFNITFGALANFLNDNIEGWNVSSGAREKICAYLLAYCDECRNEHFHKDNIDIEQIGEVDVIRHNTLLLFYYLLGAYKLTNDDLEDEKILGIERNPFEELFNILMASGRGQYYILSFPSEENTLVAFPMNQKLPDYDRNGRLNDLSLRFIRINRNIDDDWETDDWVEIENDESSKNVIMVNSNNMPYSVVYLDKLSGEQSKIW